MLTEGKGGNCDTTAKTKLEISSVVNALQSNLHVHYTVPTVPEKRGVEVNSNLIYLISL